MNRTFVWAIAGRDGNNNSWATEGEFESNDGDTIHGIIAIILATSFAQLTHGKARYGNPGVGCTGPYKTTSIVITEKQELN